MNDFQIETAQNVGISQNVANIGERMLGYLIDSAVIFIYTICIFWLLVKLDLDFGEMWAVYLLLSLPAFLYYVLLETFWDGKTIGKFLLKMRVVKLDGSKPSFANYFVRWILRIVDVVITFGGLATLTILFKGNGQRVGDIAAGTTVISQKERLKITHTMLVDLPVDYKPTYTQVTVLNDEDIRSVKSLYDDAVAKGHHNVIINLSTRLKKIMQVESEENPIDFVSTVIKDYNFYAQQL